MCRFNWVTISAGVPAGATTTSQPSSSKPGSVSAMVGRSSRPGKRLAELKAVESRIGATVKQREQDEVNRFKGVVTMYENMKAKEAARVFDRLDIKILVELAGLINPRKMSEILAQMSPEAAERLTVEIASRAAAQKSQSADALPQIEGKQNPR